MCLGQAFEPVLSLRGKVCIPEFLFFLLKKNLSLEESQNLKTAEERQKSHIAEVLKQTAKKGVLQKAVEEQLQ